MFGFSFCTDELCNKYTKLYSPYYLSKFSDESSQRWYEKCHIDTSTNIIPIHIWKKRLIWCRAALEITTLAESHKYVG